MTGPRTAMAVDLQRWLSEHLDPTSSTVERDMTLLTQKNRYRYTVYTGQMKVALVDVETLDNPIPLESYHETRQGVGGHLSPRKAFYYYKFI